jgi:hypothetical protein
VKNVPLKEEGMLRGIMVRLGGNTPITVYNYGKSRNLKGCMACWKDNSGVILKRLTDKEG